MSKKQQTSSNELHEFIMKTIMKEKPETTEELLSIISQKYPSTPEENKNALEKLEAGNKIQFTKKIPSQPPKLKKLTFLHRALWFWLTLAISIVTVIAVFAIPQDAYPLTYLRQILGTVFVLFLPGFSLCKNAFSIQSSNCNLIRKSGRTRAHHPQLWTQHNLSSNDWAGPQLHSLGHTANPNSHKLACLHTHFWRGSCFTGVSSKNSRQIKNS